MSKRGIIAPLILVVILAIAGLIALGISIGKKSSGPTATNSAIASPTPLSTGISVKVDDETANWKTYQGDGFIFQYPPMWGIIANKSNDFLAQVACLQQCVSPNEFSIHTVSYKSADEYIKSIKNNQEPIDIRQTSINGEAATEILIPLSQGIGFVQYFIIHEGQGYVLMWSVNKLANLKQDTEILSTFKFTDSSANVGAGCMIDGCSGQICTEEGKGVTTTCEYKAEYACYKTAKCEKQANGQCGWTQTAELSSCLTNPQKR